MTTLAPGSARATVTEQRAAVAAASAIAGSATGAGRTDIDAHAADATRAADPTAGIGVLKNCAAAVAAATRTPAATDLAKGPRAAGAAGTADVSAIEPGAAAGGRPRNGGHGGGSQGSRAAAAARTAVAHHSGVAAVTAIGAEAAVAAMATVADDSALAAVTAGQPVGGAVPTVSAVTEQPATVLPVGVVRSTGGAVADQSAGQRDAEHCRKVDRRRGVAAGADEVVRCVTADSDGADDTLHDAFHR
ncbi:hypothetical protein BV510_12705 [Mycolicibacterium diernhoferi]|uniref:Uncharacterized protein n=1 Tax=Mycolicibacterium diernhoferi TaxID=1801 RepID=A0A1T3WIR4_9MYCO|nr:hypothetical protein BV510_12705 [Mycolicibacterium diernhoferi]